MLLIAQAGGLHITEKLDAFLGDGFCDLIRDASNIGDFLSQTRNLGRAAEGLQVGAKEGSVFCVVLVGGNVSSINDTSQSGCSVDVYRPLEVGVLRGASLLVHSCQKVKQVFSLGNLINFK
jgi:hypothetical protein